MELGALKPLLTSLVMPPLSLLLLAFGGLFLAARKKRGGIALATLALALLWLLSCHGTAVWLARTALQQFPPATLSQLKASKVQAVVVLGGGIFPQAPEYGQAQPGAATAARLRYGVWLARQSGLPLAFTGGMGLAASSAQHVSEAEVAARLALQDYGFSIRWLESKSRDTSENARLLAPLLQKDGVQRIALVTDASHMPRSIIAFERAGFAVTPAATGYVLPVRNGLLEWLPSASGLQASQRILHEWLGILAGRWLPV
ncbi:YdcF family protein [Polaromonas sp.]|uniref:YdcF family protein n=1 Tax=Polaromonas sp. TaxID=1869339 RepID=UPI003BA8809B